MGERRLNYDDRTTAAMLAALMTCPPDKRLDSLAAVIRIFVEDRLPAARQHAEEQS